MHLWIFIHFYGYEKSPHNIVSAKSKKMNGKEKFIWLFIYGELERQIKLNLCDLTEAFNNIYATMTESLGYLL